MVERAKVTDLLVDDLPNFGKSQPVVPATPYVPPSPADSLTGDALQPFQGTPLGNDRRANAAEYVDKPRVVGGNIAAEELLRSPVAGFRPEAVTAQGASTPTAPVQVSEPGGKITANLSQNDLAIKDSLGAIDSAIAGGMRPTAEQSSQIMELKQQAGFLRGGTDRRPVGADGRPLQAQSGGGGGLTVQFDADTDPAAKARFLEAPVSPTAQIDRYNANVGNDADQGQLAAQNASRILGPNNNRELPKIGWQERKAYNVQGMQNQQAAENAQLQASTSQLGFRNQREIADAGNVIQADRNKVLASEAESQGGLRTAQAKLADTQADELPLDRKSQLGLREAQTNLANAQADASKYIKLKVPSGEKNQLGEPIFNEVAVDQKGNVLNPAASASPAAGLSPEQRAKAVTYAKANPKVDKNTILAKIKAGEL